MKMRGIPIEVKYIFEAKFYDNSLERELFTRKTTKINLF